MTTPPQEASAQQLDFTLSRDSLMELRRTIRHGARGARFDRDEERKRFAAELRVAGRVLPSDDATVVDLRAAYLVLADLVEQGWDIRLDGDAIVLFRTPASPQVTMDVAKEQQRRTLQVARDRQLRHPAVVDFLRSMERPRVIEGRFVSVLDLVDDGATLAAELGRITQLPGPDQESALAKIVRPTVEVCGAGRTCQETGLLLNDIWRYFRHSWSLEYRPTPGRSIAFLIRNAARPFAPVMGIALLVNAPTRLKVRDDWIGWTLEALIARLQSECESELAFMREISNALRSALDEAINQIWMDDLEITPEERLYPSAATVQHLRERATQAEANRTSELTQGIDQRKMPTRSDGTTDWQAAAARPLFVRKRAATLADLLETRRLFTDAGLEQRPEALRDLLTCEAGRSAVNVALAEMRKRALASRLLDVSVCGAIAPYNALLGGKLVALLMTSREIAESCTARYGGHVSLIASQMAGRPITRSAVPQLLTTTSLYGAHSSQYNRLRLRASDHEGLPWDIAWRELGQTKGYGTVHFSTETVEALRQVGAARHGMRRVNNVFGEGTSPRLRQVREGLDALGLNSDLLLRHDNRRLVYACELVPDARAQLWQDAHPSLEREHPSADVLGAAWRRRWLLARIQRLDVLEQVRCLGPETLQMSLAGDVGVQLAFSIG